MSWALVSVDHDPHGWAVGKHRSRGPSVSQKAVTMSTQAEGGGGNVAPGCSWNSAGLQTQAGLGGLAAAPSPVPVSPSPGPPCPLWRPRPPHTGSWHTPRGGGRRALSSEGTGCPSAENKGGWCPRGKQETSRQRPTAPPTRAASNRPIRPQPHPGLRSRVLKRKSRDSGVHDQTPKEVAGGCPGQG